MIRKIFEILNQSLPEYSVSLAFFCLSLTIHFIVLTGSLNNGYQLKQVIQNFSTFPIAAFTLYFTFRALCTDTYAYFTNQNIFSGKYLLFVFQLYLLILLFDAYRQIIKFEPFLFIGSIFITDIISFILTKNLVHAHNWHITSRHEDQFFFSSLKIFIWYILLPATYVFSIVFLHH